MAEVCIIGSGFSGLLAAKISLSHNFTPFIYEKSTSIGGLWNPSPDRLGVWDTLYTNTSKPVLTISDHPWPSEVPGYPQRSHIVTYLNSFISKHNLLQYISFATEVIQISKTDDTYSVTFSQNKETFTKTFKFVICATGAFSIPNDQFEGKENFKGLVLHSGHYRNSSVFENKNVVVVGRAYSAGDISLEALSNAKTVTQVYRKPYMCFRREMLGFPSDYFLFNLDNKDLQVDLFVSKESNREFYRQLGPLLENAGDILEEWRITEEDLDREFYNSSVNHDGYYEAVRTGQIKCIRGELTRFEENGLVLADGTVITADVVVLATGFFTNYSYLSEDIQRTLKYNPKNHKASLTLYRGCIHPLFPGLAFLGELRGFFTGRFELQSELAIRYFTKTLNITQEEMWEGVYEEERRRESADTYFIYSFFGALQEHLRILNIQIDFNFLRSLEYTSGPLCSVMFWKDRAGQEDLIRQYVAEVKQRYPNFNFNK